MFYFVNYTLNWYRIREQRILYTKSEQVLHRKSISLLTDLKVSSLACKCVFYRSEYNEKELNFEGLEIQEKKIYQQIELKE